MGATRVPGVGPVSLPSVLTVATLSPNTSVALMSRSRRSHVVVMSLTLFLFAIPAAGQAPVVDTARYGALHWREIGPFRGGRVDAVSGVVGQPLVYYMGATGGGIWKTGDGGLTW